MMLAGRISTRLQAHCFMWTRLFVFDTVEFNFERSKSMQDAMNARSVRPFALPSVQAMLLLLAVAFGFTSARAQTPGQAGMLTGPFSIGTGKLQGVSSGYTYKAINFPGASGTFAYAINDQDQVVGFYTGAGCSQSTCGFLYSKGKFSTIECALEDSTDVFDISNKGEIIGTYSDSGQPSVNGFIWEGNSSCFDVVDPNNAGTTQAEGVNDSGEIVGFYDDASGNDHGFSYLNAAYTTIDCPGETGTLLFGINDSGVMVGADYQTSLSDSTGFVYKSGKCTTVSFPGAISTQAIGINKSEQLSGLYNDDSGYYGFVKTGNTYQSLSYPGSLGTVAFHLNDAGLVAGFYLDSSSTYHGFIATPESTPPSKTRPWEVSFSPSAGPVGTTVAIMLQLPETVTGVTFGGTPANDYTVDSSTELTAVVPSGAKTGPVGVNTLSGTLTSAAIFTVD
jgi:probable HAF family extracellular repeat protein